MSALLTALAKEGCTLALAIRKDLSQETVATLLKIIWDTPPLRGQKGALPVSQEQTGADLVKLTKVASLLAPGYTLPPSESPYCVYVVSGPCCLYVGKAKEPVARLRQHLGVRGLRHMSPLGILVCDNLPESLDWVISFLTLAECQWYIQHECPLRRHHPVDPEQAEIALIRLFRPCLNLDKNMGGYRLPKRYWACRSHALIPRHLRKIEKERGISPGTLSRLIAWAKESSRARSLLEHIKRLPGTRAPVSLPAVDEELLRQFRSACSKHGVRASTVVEGFLREQLQVWAKEEALPNRFGGHVSGRESSRPARMSRVIHSPAG